MRFSLFLTLFQCIFCIWVPNMASLLGPIIYFHHSDVRGGGGGVGVTSHTPRIFFPKVFPCLLFIISHYPVSYILGENIPPGEYSPSVDTSF
jgi:hypothetical protein